MKAKGIVVILVLILLVAWGLGCGRGGEPAATPTAPHMPTLTPTPQLTLTPQPTRTPPLTRCEADRDTIQLALYLYHQKGEWPTADGQPGDIDWDKLVPGILYEIPSTDSRCDWQVNSNPEGEVCLRERC